MCARRGFQPRHTLYQRGELGRRLAGSTKRGIIQNVEIFTHCARSIFRFDLPRGPVFRVAGVLLLHIRADQAGVCRKTLPADKAFFNTTCDGYLKYLAQEITLAETTVPVLRKS